MKLLIGNRNYSTWSLRPWLVLKHFEIPFEDEILQLSGPRWRETLAERSPTGKVPVLIDDDLVIPETIAIIEYLAERPKRPCACAGSGGGNAWRVFGIAQQCADELAVQPSRQGRSGCRVH